MRISDWSSDVCSADLPTHYRGISRAGTVEQGADRPRTILLGQRSAHANEIVAAAHKHRRHPGGRLLEVINFLEVVVQHFAAQRSEERRVGKECVSPCRSRWSPYN